jgi:hypothetical protein
MSLTHGRARLSTCSKESGAALMVEAERRAMDPKVAREASIAEEEVLK